MRRFLKWRPGAAALAAVVFTCAWTLGGAGPARAGGPVSVDCTQDTGALTKALGAVTAGDQLLIKGRCVGSFTLDRDLTLGGVAGAVLDGGDSSSLGPVLGVAPGVTVDVQHLQITGGTGQDCISFPVCPFNLPIAGIDNHGTLVLSHVVVSGMHHDLAHLSSIGADGAIENWAGAVLVMRNSSVIDNESEAVAVGPAAAYGAIANGGTMVVKNSEVIRNSATAWTDAVGGIWNTGVLVISNSTVGGNTAAGLGQIVVGGILNDSGGTLTVTNSDVDENTATFDATYPLLDQIAGGIYNAGSIVLQNSSVAGNSPNNCNFADSDCG